ncbi:MAG: gamma carbonic anhydrase family protein [Geminicoccaceae bacterium]|nr:MAG: gamma carbonic anhydrase family protein [Geminicoccaceae bacterium]
MPIYALDDAIPEIDPTAWIAPTAVLIGRVKVLPGATIWFGAVIRADNEPITIGEGSNVQENCVMHTDPGYPLVVGPNVTVGHLAMLHGCTIGEGSLVGIGATILNGAVIGARCLVGAHALIPENRTIGDDSLVMGAPGKVVKDVTPEQAKRMAEGTATYVARGAHYRGALRQVD